jgi:hypothetical protein
MSIGSGKSLLRPRFDKALQVYVSASFFKRAARFLGMM